MQIEPKSIKLEDVPKRLGMLETMIKDDQTYNDKDVHEILKDIFNFRILVSNDLSETVGKIGRNDIIEMFQRLTITAEMDVLADLNDRLNEMLKTATYLAETSALGAIAAYLELKSRKEEFDIQDSERRDEKIREIVRHVKLGEDEKTVLLIYEKYVKKDWKWFKERFGIDDQNMIERMLNNRGIIEQARIIITELEISKCLEQKDMKTLRSLLKRYAMLTNNKLMITFLNSEMPTLDIVKLFKGVFKILKIE